MNTQSARWDCPFCGRKGLLDSHTVCSACRTKRPADGKYEERTETYREEIIEEVPVYKQKYKYRIPRWVKIEQLKASGQDKNPYWPTDARLNNKKQYRIFDLRGKYFVIFKLTEGTTADAEVSKPVWEDIVEGQEVKVVKHSLSGKYTIVTRE